MPDSQLLWVDTETTGVNIYQSAIVQLAGMIEINHNIESEFDIKMCPHKGAHIDDKALKHNNLTKEDIEAYPDYYEGFKLFKSYLADYVDRFDAKDKFVMCGYNIKFDSDMIRSLFTRCRDTYFGSWFFWPVIDVQNSVAEQVAENGLRLDNYQLSTVCKHYGIEIDAHEAMSDIRATRTLYYKLKEIK